MMDESITMDTNSRKKIVEELDKNFFVEASAGSGKTTSLVYRMVAIVEKGEITVDKICTITFTKAAADEFFNRFQALLSTRSVLVDDESDDKLGKKTEESVKRCQEALSNIDSCFLGTIDAFCNMIAHELPSELDIPSFSEVVDMDEYISIVQEKFLTILKDEKDPLHKKALRFKELIYSYVDALTIGVKAFLEMRHTEIVFDNELADIDIEEYFESEKDTLLQIMSDLTSLDYECFNSDKAGKDRSQALLSLKSNYLFHLSLENWNKCIPFLKFALDNILKMEGFNKNIIGTDAENYIFIPEKVNERTSYKYTDEFKAFINSVKDKLKEYIYSVYCDFVSELSHEMELVFKEQGKFQFFDFLYYLNEAFKKSEKGDRELINHILERHSVFLLDESQDTNPMQTELFFHLTGTVNNDDWRKVKPKEGSLFIVGDPKQSIYSFRDANVSTFISNKNIFALEDEVLVLTRNFRSNVRLREWFNKTMNTLLDKGVEPLEHLDIPIIDIEKENEQISNDVIDGVYTYTAKDKDDGEDIAKIILSLVGKKKIYTKNENGSVPKKKERLIRYSDFMVVPRSTDVSKITKAFTKYSIPVTIEASIPFENTQSLIVVRDLIYLLKEPQNISNFLNVAHGDLYKLSDKEIIFYKNIGFDLNIARPFIVTSNPKLSRVLEELNSLYIATYRMSYSSTMLYIINNPKLNLFSRISATNLEYTLFLIQKIKEKEEDGSLRTLEQLKGFVSSFLEGNDDQRSLRFKDKLDRVKLSNVHKVKGLQAPIVILAKPKKKERDPNKYVDYSSNPPKTYFSKLGMMGDFGNEVTFIETKKYIDDLPKWKESDIAERERLEYVAATRAESVLIIGKYSKINKNEYNPWQELYDSVDENDNNGNLEIDESIAPLPLTKVNVTLEDYRINTNSHLISHKYISPSQMRIKRVNNNLDEVDNVLLEDENTINATLLGTIVHRLLECMVSSKNTYNIDDLVNKISNEYVIDDEQKELLVRTANRIISGGFPQKNSALDDDILSTLLTAKNVWCEVPFSYLSKSNNIVSGIIDVLYLDQNEKYHVIDYKTNVEDDVSILEKEYEEQLTSYVYALKKMGIDCDAHIYHIDLNN